MSRFRNLHGKNVDIDERNPDPIAFCDRCGLPFNISHLRWQFGWSGNQYVNKRILVCERCYDEPNEQQRPISIPADPQSILNARPVNYQAAFVNNYTISGPLGRPMMESKSKMIVILTKS